MNIPSKNCSVFPKSVCSVTIGLRQILLHPIRDLGVRKIFLFKVSKILCFLNFIMIFRFEFFKSLEIRLFTLGHTFLSTFFVQLFSTFFCHTLYYLLLSISLFLSLSLSISLFLFSLYSLSISLLIFTMDNR